MSNLVDDQYQDLIDRIDVEGYDKLDRTGVGTVEHESNADHDIPKMSFTFVGEVEKGKKIMREECQYLGILRRVINEGVFKGDRTGVGCYSVYGEMMRFDLTGGKIPLLTTKKMGIKSIIAELLWFLEGSTNSKRLNELGAKIWDEWALDNGDTGKIYGKQWIAWEDTKLVPVEIWLDQEAALRKEGYRYINEFFDSELGESVAILRRDINQIQELITSLKENPNSRRMLVTAWNPAVLPQDYRWEYNYFEGMESLPQACGWKPMTLDQRMNWLFDQHGIGNGIFDADILEQHATPTHRRKVKVTPQDNVRDGKASLAACHTFFQVHTREMEVPERGNWLTANRPELSTVYNDYAAKVLPFSFKHDLNGQSEEEKIAARKRLASWLDRHSVPRYGLTLQFYCRSQDVPIGTPYNIASYAILAQMLAQCTGMVAEELIYTAGDIHIYKNQLDGVKIQLEREPFPFPTIRLNPDVKDIFSFKVDDFELIGYQHHPKIDFGDVAV